MIAIHCTLFLTIVFPEFFVMAHLECYRETETAIFATRTNLPVSDFQTWQVWYGSISTNTKFLVNVCTYSHFSKHGCNTTQVSQAALVIL